MTSLLQTLAPGFLVAAPSLRDPNFDHSVVLMCVHNDDGAMGLVINRPAPVTMGDILSQMQIEHARDGKVDLEQAAMVGGPVALDSGLLLYQVPPGTASREDELTVADELRLCPNQQLLREIGLGQAPGPYHIFLGHAGWGPGQLESEISQGAWIPASLVLSLVFETPVDERWEAALANEGLSPAQVGTFRPSN
ncbi:MAG: YqgE/AlgH family protein [Myxococcales bacterium]|nr:YqgE/AlgH family protein [Myxococcales bacterium]